MKKIKNAILVLIIILMTSGCSATYNLVINDNSFKEETNIFEYEDVAKKTKYSKNYTVYDFFVLSSSNYYKTDYTNAINDDDGPIQGVSYYETNYTNKNNVMEMNFKNNFTLRNIANSNMAHSCYEKFSVLRSGKEVFISTSNKATCFETYGSLDSVVINITTNYEVTYNNADSVNGIVYTWIIDRNNYNDKNISLTYNPSKTTSDSSSSTDTKTPSNNTKDNQTNKGNNTITEENSNLLTIVIFCILGIILLIAIVVLIQKKMNNDRL